MSRSALNKKHNINQNAAQAQAAQAYYQQQYAQQYMYSQQMQMMAGYMPFVPIATAGEDFDPNHAANALPIHGNSSTYNINNLLYNNIMENEYFRALYQLRTYHEVIDEITRTVTHVEPWHTGTARSPSTAFCLLVKFMGMRLTVKQMNGLLNNGNSPHVRAIGFLYLRYTIAPAELWKWFEPFLDDEEEFSPYSDKSVTVTVGEYIIKLLTEMQYCGTTLPRIPVPIERKIKVMLLLNETRKKRREGNLLAEKQGRFAEGEKVRAIYSDEHSEPAWYDAVVVSKEESAEHKYWVTFPEYGNTECVDLGDMELPDAPSQQPAADSGQEDRRGKASDYDKGDRKRGRSRSRSESTDGRRRGRSGSRNRKSRRSSSRDRGSRRSRSRDRQCRRSPSDSDTRRSSAVKPANLMEQVLQSERDASLAVGKKYANRPVSYKGSLSLKADRYTVRQKSPTASDRRNRQRSRSHEREPKKETQAEPQNKPQNTANQERLKLLMEKYGNASAQK